MSEEEKIPSSWEGVYQTWEEAKSEGQAFASDRWIKRITGQLLDYRRAIASQHNVPPPRPSDLPLLCALVQPKSILDFGGSSGWVWEFLNESSINQSVDEYLIMEIDSVVNFMDESNFHQLPVIYLSNIESQKLDVVYTNSVLQYIDVDEVFFSVIEKTNPEWVLIEDFLGGSFNDFYSLQVYWDYRIPVKFRNREKFISAFKNIGYECVLSKPYLATIRGSIRPLPMSALPEDKQVSYGETMLLKRKK